MLLIERGVTINVRGTWPITFIDDWCGQHKPAVVGADNPQGRYNEQLSELTEKVTERRYRRPKP